MYLYMITKKTKSKKAFAIFFLVFGLVWFILGSVFFISSIAFVNNAITTSAIIIKNIEVKDKGGSILYTPQYRYTDNEGVPFVNLSNNSSYPPRYTENQSIQILYSRSNHGSSRINSFEELYLIQIIFITCGALFGISGYLVGRKHWQDKIVWEDRKISGFLSSRK